MEAEIGGAYSVLISLDSAMVLEPGISQRLLWCDQPRLAPGEVLVISCGEECLRHDQAAAGDHSVRFSVAGQGWGITGYRVNHQ